MPALPGDPGAKVYVRRKGRKPKPPSARQTQQAHAQESAYVSQGRAVERQANRQNRGAPAQRATRGAMPLDAAPGRPPVIERPPAPRTQAKPLASVPPRNVRPGKPVVTKRQQRAVAVAAYDQLPSGAAKRAHVQAARKRIQAGKATTTDKAVVHIHDTRVQGSKNVQRAVNAYNAIAGDPVKIAKLRDVASRISDDPTNALSSGIAPKHGLSLNLPPGSTYGAPNKSGQRPILDRSGKKVGVVQKYEKPRGGTVANLPSAGKVVATLGPLATQGLNRTSLPKVIKNIPKDAGELAVTSPTAVAKSISTAVSHPKQEAKALAGQYGELAKHPRKFISDKPVTAALMLNPLARAPGLAAGKVLRTAGKQTLEREVATLPGTALREARTGSRAAGRRAVQSVKDKRAVTKGTRPQVTARQLDQRVDEAFSAAQHHATRVRSSMGAAAKELAKEHPKGSQERKDLLESGRLAAKGAVKHQTQRMFAREFGATARVEHPRPVAKVPRSTALPSREEFIAARPRPAHGTPEPGLPDVAADVHPTGKPGITVESGFTRSGKTELPRMKVVVARDTAGRPIGALKMFLDEHGKPDLLEVAVDSAHRGQGLGSKLYAAAAKAGYDVEHASGAGGLTEAGAALKHKRLTARTLEQAPIEKPRVVENPHATEGHLHSNVEDARAVAEHLNAKNLTVKRGHGNLLSGDPVGRVYAKEDVPVKFVVRKIGETKHAVMPEQAAQRLAHHQSVGSTQARGAKILRTSRTMFTRAVLPWRPSWLSGQGVEGSVRAAVKQAGPTSFLRAKRFVKALERQEPGSGKAFLERTSPSGLIGSHQIETPNRTLHEEFPGSNVARALTDLGKTPGLKQVRDLNRHVTDFVFNKVNAKVLEGVPQTAMLGKVLKDSPLMERKLVGLSNKAMDEAARGGVQPHTAAQLLRELQKSYGKYEGFSPHTRELISHWTPFLPWYLNTAKFLLSTLPKDHPFATALIADMDSATEDWRKQQGLSFRHKENRVPGFMLGGYPVKGDSVVGKALGLKKGETHILRIGHYTPAGIGSDVLGATSGLPLPQFSGFYNAMLGLDWKNQPLKHEDGSAFSDSEKFVYGLTQLAEAMIPLSGQVASVTGVPGMEPPAPDKGEALKKLIRPISAVPRKKDQGGLGIAPLELSPLQVQQIQLGG